MRQTAPYGSVRLHCTHPRVKKRNFSPSICDRKLKDPGTASLFQSAFKVKVTTATTAAATDADVDAETTNRVQTVWSKPRDPLLDAAIEVVCLSKAHHAKHAGWLAIFEAEKTEFAAASPDYDGVFRIAKQMDHTNNDGIGENNVRNDACELALTDEDKIMAWE